MAAASRARTPGGASHLPNRRGDSAPGPPRNLPRQLRGVTPQMRGRYPRYNVLDSADHWDAKTRTVVMERVGEVPPVRFFDETEARALGVFCDVVTGQDSEPRIPVLAMVDARLFEGRLDGFRYHDMPPDALTWRAVAAKLDASARERGAEAGFAAASDEVQQELVECFSKGELDWDIPVDRAWAVVTRMIVAAFYSHPWAWNEIGFGGPAYPRGYARLGPGQREHWESPPEFERDPVHDARERGLE